jgi:hypothetical protein
LFCRERPGLDEVPFKGCRAPAQLHPAFAGEAHFITTKLSPQSAQLDQFAGFSVFGNSGDFAVWAIGAGNRVNRIPRVREVIRAVTVCKDPFAFLPFL